MKVIKVILAMAIYSQCLTAQITVTDVNFKNYLVNNTAINTDLDLEISELEASSFTGDITVTGLAISDMLGIEMFTSATRLFCGNNTFTELDLTSNTELTFIQCSYNQFLTTLDVSNCPKLSSISCTNTSLASLDLSNNPVFEALDCVSNKLKTLDLRNGNNTMMAINFNIKGNFLLCVSVDNKVWSDGAWSSLKDAGTVFSEDCTLGIDPLGIPDKAEIESIHDILGRKVVWFGDQGIYIVKTVDGRVRKIFYTK